MCIWWNDFSSIQMIFKSQWKLLNGKMCSVSWWAFSKLYSANDKTSVCDGLGCSFHRKLRFPSVKLQQLITLFVRLKHLAKFTHTPMHKHMHRRIKLIDILTYLAFYWNFLSYSVCVWENNFIWSSYASEKYLEGWKVN